MLLCVVATLFLMPFALLGTNNYVYMTNNGIYENAYFSMTEREYLFEENQVLLLEKKYNDKGEISVLYCYMYNDKTKFNILDADLGIEMTKGILNSPGMRNVRLSGDISITHAEREALLVDVGSYDTRIVLDWFLNEYLPTHI